MNKVKGNHNISVIHSLLLAVLIQVPYLIVYGQQRQDSTLLETYRNVSDFADDNERCFSCHGGSRYHVIDDSSDVPVEWLMCQDRIILREKFYRCNHKSFSCLDCHSESLLVFPHPAEALTSEYSTCLDCHGNDEQYAHFQFEKIESEYLQSIHNLEDPEGFSCWKCHDPHTYNISARNTENLSATIAYDNNICLSCHSDTDPNPDLVPEDSMDIFSKHDWLPNEELHFRKVRCIDCHTKISDSIMIAHLVTPERDAVRNCRECHSKNSILLSTLYKFQSKEARREYGFLNAVIMNNAYVTGANRNYILSITSLVIIGLVFAGILVHIIFRMRNRNKI